MLKGKEITDVSPETMKVLMTHDYPGNVRELENIIERVFALSSESIIKPDHLPDDIAKTELQPVKPTFGDFDQLEKQFLLDALKQNDWNRDKTARELKMHKTTLYRKIRKLGIVLPSIDGRSRHIK